jgi:hypothetical protein
MDDNAIAWDYLTLSIGREATLPLGAAPLSLGLQLALALSAVVVKMAYHTCEAYTSRHSMALLIWIGGPFI